ncbi:MAG: squalene/phytoene synthase family protein [Bdellovibrionota bacterium]
MLEPKFYKAHLEKVSRSFAFCIDELETELQEKVALAYLLFRVLDTVEDSKWSTEALQKKAFSSFLDLCENRTEDKNEATNEFIQLFSQAECKPEEKNLINDSLKLFLALKKLSDKDKAPLLLALKTMCSGMQHFTFIKKHQLNNLSELDSYCYYVAGCIGELLTAWTSGESSETRIEESIHFGLFLQKINILKDFQDDSQAGRNFLWSWQEVANTLKSHASAAFRYIQNIPAQRKDYKIFCSWSLFLGLFSYPTIEKSLLQKKKEKISRLEAWQLLNTVKKNILRENDLNLIFESFLSKLPVSTYEINTKNLPSIC